MISYDAQRKTKRLQTFFGKTAEEEEQEEDAS